MDIVIKICICSNVIVQSGGYFLRRKYETPGTWNSTRTGCWSGFLTRGPQQPNTALSGTPMENLKERDKNASSCTSCKILNIKVIQQESRKSRKERKNNILSLYPSSSTRPQRDKDRDISISQIIYHDNTHTWAGLPQQAWSDFLDAHDMWWLIGKGIHDYISY